MSRKEDRIGRAAAQRRDDDIAGIPTTPHSTIWQYTSPHYEAESSLSSLSLVASDAVTRARSTRARAIEEIDTQPPRKPMRPAERDEATATVIMPGVPAQPVAPRRQQEPASWTAGRGANSLYARRIVEPERKRGYARSRPRPFESLRWWLLFPGRIEFLLCVMGALLLIALSVLLLPLTFFSLITPGMGQGSAMNRQGSPTADTTVTSFCVVTQQGRSACDAVRVTSPTGLEITLLNTDQVQNGAPLQLRGRGFTALSQVSFTCDTHWQCRPALLRVDAHGMFFANLMPEGESDWVPGWHQIVVQDMVTKYAISLPFTLLTAAPAVVGSPTALPSVSPTDTPTVYVEPTS
jgi:hypothetical protein